VIEMATINGARCAGLAESLGSVEVGKDADIVLFDTTFPEWQPLYNPVSNLVYSATGNSVKDVYVAGTRVVADGHLTQMDEAEVLKLVHAAMDRIGRRLDTGKLSKLRWPVM
jgi:cytosine/adenosine deaminase-related metal-dependent hydrolase